MSVLSRHRTVPSPRTSGGDAARLVAPTQPSEQAPTPGPSRTAIFVSGAVLVAAAAAGATTYILAQNDSASPAERVELPFNSEVQRDRATAARGGTGGAAAADTEAQRDAAAAARHASR